MNGANEEEEGRNTKEGGDVKVLTDKKRGGAKSKRVKRSVFYASYRRGRTKLGKCKARYTRGGGDTSLVDNLSGKPRGAGKGRNVGKVAAYKPTYIFEVDKSVRLKRR